MFFYFFFFCWNELGIPFVKVNLSVERLLWKRNKITKCIKDKNVSIRWLIELRIQKRKKKHWLSHKKKSTPCVHMFVCVCHCFAFHPNRATKYKKVRQCIIILYWRFVCMHNAHRVFVCVWERAYFTRTLFGWVFSSVIIIIIKGLLSIFRKPTISFIFHVASRENSKNRFYTFSFSLFYLLGI